MTEPPPDPWAVPTGQPGQQQPPTPPPAWGQQPSWEAGPPVWGAPPPAVPVPALPVNPWAVVALVCGILPLFPVALAAGITALVQNGRGRYGGSGLAIAGVVLAALWALVGGGILLALLFGGPMSGDLGRVAHAGSTTVGTCLVAPDEEDFVGRPIDCAQRHDAEVYLVQPVSEQVAWPGYSRLDEDADDLCYEGFDDYVGEEYDESEFDYGYFSPDEAEWREGERRVICVVLPYDDDHLTGSARDNG